MLRLNHKLNDIVINPDSTPLWADKIKRWSQLDEASYVLAEATFSNLDYLKDSFDQLVVVTGQGSNTTDYKFVHDTKISPSNFVHTLPNVRTIVFSLLTGWEGQMFCLNKGDRALVNYLESAPIVDQHIKTLVISMNKVGNTHQCDFYKIGESIPDSTLYYTKENNGQIELNDFDFRNSLSSKSEIAISSEFSLRKVIS